MRSLFLPRLVVTMALVASAGAGCGAALGSSNAPIVGGEAPAGSCALVGGGPRQEDEAAIRSVLEAEGAAIVHQDVAGLMALWTDDGAVIDAKHTPNVEDDDQRWQGTDAIRHRYLQLVFPGAPTRARPTDLVITVRDTQAQVTSSTHIGNEMSPAGDRWQLVKIGDCWLLQSLTFNLEGP